MGQASREDPTCGASTESSLLGTVVSCVRSVVGTDTGTVSLHEPLFQGREGEYVRDCIDSGWVSSVGKYVDRFEIELARYTGSRYVIATCNGTAALHVSLVLAGVLPDDEVLVPALTFVATANAISYCNAKPHFVDVDLSSLAVDPTALEDHLLETADRRNGYSFNRKTGARISALVIMHAFGHPARVTELAEVAARWHLTLVEDAAESLGSWVGDQHTGTFGLLGTLSFNGNKVITTGGGGAILTSDESLARRAKHITTTARLPHRWNFLHDETGFNYRMPNLNAALGCAQLEQLPNLLLRKRMLAERYENAFASVSGVTFQKERPGTTSNYWLNVLMLDRPDQALRDELLSALNASGLASRPAWTLMHRLPMFARAFRAPLSVSEDVAARLVNIPSSPSLVPAT